MSMVSDVTTYVKEYDPEVGAALEQELGRQRRNLELIASENIVTPQVMMAMGTVPTNKYAEGYPGKRYYGGCEYVDVIENLAIERAKKLFGSEHGSVPGIFEAGGHGNGTQPGSWRTPDTRITGQYVRDTLPLRTVQHQ